MTVEDNHCDFCETNCDGVSSMITNMCGITLKVCQNCSISFDNVAEEMSNDMSASEQKRFNPSQTPRLLPEKYKNTDGSPKIPAVDCNLDGCPKWPVPPSDSESSMLSSSS